MVGVPIVATGLRLPLLSVLACTLVLAAAVWVVV
jgi:hypothetical protein